MRTWPFLLVALLAAGCSFPTSEFTLRPTAPADVPPSDTTPPGDAPPDTEPPPDTGPTCGERDQACCTTGDGGVVGDGGVARCEPGLVCAAGRCVATCPMGQTSCGDACVNAQTDPTNCGGCGNRCAGAPNAGPGCEMGACTLACNAGFADCDGDRSNGCETDTRSSTTNCGGCGNSCALPNTEMAVCMNGMCAVGACTIPFLNCDGMAANGCETDSRTSSAHCRTCGNACPAASPACVGSACRAVTSCLAPLLACGMACVNPMNDPANCGSCGNTCPARTNATPVCTPSGCNFVCSANYENCDGMATNGCETDLRTSVMHCNTCGRACPAGANATASCRAGVCALACNRGFGDCDVAVPGCETALNTATSCGACGRVCMLPNATARCTTDGTCAVATCNTGYADCDGNATNGCETDTRSNPTHCGRCMSVCPAATTPNTVAACVNSVCGTACRRDYGDCDGNRANGCELYLSASTNCGRCGNVCRTPTRCTPLCIPTGCFTCI